MSLTGNADGKTLVGNINRCDVLTISAYGIAVKNGFEGTEEEWLESLRGGALDTTFTKQGVAADAKAVGDALNTKSPSAHTHTASEVGARPNTWMPTATEVGARPSNWTPTASDVGATPASHATNKNNPHAVTAEQVGARPNTWMPSASDVGARPSTWTPTATEVGARPNTWMPTAAQVGAAPAGYGLGGFAVPVPGNNLDTLKANGWYYCADSTAGGPSGYALGNAVVEVSAGSAYSPVHQTLHFGTAGRQPFTIKRYWNNATSAWVDWEWINPPMLAGGEYRTTERYKGKAVYTKLINFGYLPNATKGGISNDVAATLVIRCEGVTSNGYTLPYNYNGNIIDLCAEKGWILITTNKDYSTAMADIQIWYTKD